MKSARLWDFIEFRSQPWQIVAQDGVHFSLKNAHNGRVTKVAISDLLRDETYIPKADRYSNKAVAFFTRIMELNDSTYADLNANATYRLACYYVMPNNIYKPNYEKGKEFLLRSKEWAILADDKELLNKIERGLASFH